MMGIRTRALLIATTGLVSAGLAFFGCSSDNSTTSGSGGAAGSAGTAGTTSASGGSTSTSAGGSAGTGTSAAGTAGTAGSTSEDAATATGCAGRTDLAPTDGIIDAFTASGDAGDATPSGIPGGYAFYPPGQPNAPTATFSNGTVHLVMDNVPGAAAAQYVGFVIYFNDCIDATAFTGVEFTISGTISGCTMQFSANYTEDDDVATDPKGSCTNNATGTTCYSSQKAITANITTTPAAVQVPFTGTGAPTGGSPQSAVDQAQLTGIQWQFTIPAGVSGSCTAAIDISTVQFYN
jgi:hypothetical protein